MLDDRSLGDGRRTDRLGERVRGRLRIAELVLVVGLEVARVVARVEAVVPLVDGVDVPGAAARAYRRVEAERGDVRDDRGRRVVDASPRGPAP
jgi:hypothetical protein